MTSLDTQNPPRVSEFDRIVGLLERHARGEIIGPKGRAALAGCSCFDPLPARLEAELRIVGGTVRTAALIVAEREEARAGLILRLRGIAQAGDLPKNLSLFLSQVRELRGAPEKDLALAFDCRADWHTLAAAVEREAERRKAPKGNVARGEIMHGWSAGKHGERDAETSATPPAHLPAMPRPPAIRRDPRVSGGR